MLPTNCLNDNHSYLSGVIMFKLFTAKNLKSKPYLQTLSNEWELSTCAGSNFYNQGDYRNAILHFEEALKYAKTGLESGKQRTVFMLSLIHI